MIVDVAIAATADAKIIPQSRIAGVRLGMTRVQVQGALGKPLNIEPKQNELSSYCSVGSFTPGNESQTCTAALPG